MYLATSSSNSFAFQNQNLPQPTPEPITETSPIDLEPMPEFPPTLEPEQRIDKMEPKLGEAHLGTNEKDKLSKLDQIVQNLYSTHRIGSFLPNIVPPLPNLGG